MSADPQPSSPAGHDGRVLLAIAAAAALLVALAASFAWVGDDAYIAFRYAKNLAAGHGLVFNPGESPPVEGYTQLAWVLVAAAIERAGLEIVGATHVVEIALGTALVLLTARAALIGPLAIGGLGAAVAAAVLATSPGMVVWSTGGLGMALFALVIFVATERLLVAGRGGSVAVASACIALITFVRFDGPWFVAAIVLGGAAAGRLAHQPRLVRASAIGCITAVAAFGAQTAWRFTYHGDWLPNTARAKGAFGVRTLERGFDYLVSNWMAVPLLAVGLALALAYAWREHRRDPAAVLAASVIAAASLYGVLVGGDFMPMGRFLVPALPFVAWHVGRVAQASFARTRRAHGPALVTAVALLLSTPALFDLSLVPRAVRAAWTFRWTWPYESEREFLDGVDARAREWARLGRALGAHASPGDSLVRGPVGAVGYYSGITIHDRFGLTDREVATTVEPDPASMTLPGHDCKAPHGFFDDRRPTWTDVELLTGDQLDEETVAGARFAADFGVIDLFEVGPKDGLDVSGLLVLQRFVPPVARHDDAPPQKP